MLLGYVVAPATSAEEDAAAPGLVLYDPLESGTEKAPPQRVMSVPAYAQNNIEFVPGHEGNCVHFKGTNTGVKYPYAIFPFDRGTIEFWLAFDESPGTFENRHDILHYHAGKDWFSNYFTLFVGGEKDWGKTLYFMVCDGQAQRNHIGTSITTWKPGEWHHVALTWKLNDASNSAMALYLDHKLVESKSQLTIMQDKAVMETAKDDPNYGFVWLAPPGGSKTGFNVDELRLFNVQRQYSSAQGAK